MSTPVRTSQMEKQWQYTRIIKFIISALFFAKQKREKWAQDDESTVFNNSFYPLAVDILLDSELRLNESNCCSIGKTPVNNPCRRLSSPLVNWFPPLPIYNRKSPGNKWTQYAWALGRVPVELRLKNSAKNARALNHIDIFHTFHHLECKLFLQCWLDAFCHCSFLLSPTQCLPFHKLPLLPNYLLTTLFKTILHCYNYSSTKKSGI